MRQITTILFLAANPSNTTRLALDREYREIDQRIQASEHRDAFRLVPAPAVQPSDLQQYLLRHKPSIVHFSGHGEETTGELLLTDATGASKSVPPAALADLFRILGGVKCVVLNACYSEAQAKAIAEHVDAVIGMTKAFGDEAAIAFSGAFYQAMGYAKDVAKAFQFGCNQIALAGYPDAGVPTLVARTQPPAPKADPLADALAKLVAIVVDLLKKAPRVAQTLAQRIGVPESQSDLFGALAAELIHKRKARDVTKALNHLDDELEARDPESNDRDVVRRLLWRILPLAIDFRELISSGREIVASGQSAIELPLSSKTIAEIVVAGIDTRCCHFVPESGGMPIGAALVRLPAILHAPVFHNQARLAETVVKHLAAEMGHTESHADYARLRDAVEGKLLYEVEDAPYDKKLPYYLLFEEDTAMTGGPPPADGIDPQDALWAIAKTVLGRELPSLRLVRLTGGDLRDETRLASAIKAICDRKP